MRIVKVPSGEFYLEKGSNLGLGAFTFRACATIGKGGTIHLSSPSVPKELMGKRFRIKIEVIK